MAAAPASADACSVGAVGVTAFPLVPRSLLQAARASRDAAAAATMIVLCMTPPLASSGPSRLTDPWAAAPPSGGIVTGGDAVVRQRSNNCKKPLATASIAALGQLHWRQL